MSSDLGVDGVPPAPVVPIRSREQAIERVQPVAPVDLNGDDNPYKLVNRYRKARKVADAILASDSQPSADELVEMGKYEAVRELAGKAAGVLSPSKVTWALVIELVNEGRSVRRH